MSDKITQLVQPPPEMFAAYNDSGNLLLNPIMSIALVEKGTQQSIIPVVAIEGDLQLLDEESDSWDKYMGTVFKWDTKTMEDLEQQCYDSRSKKS
jgi:hypothetical protein